MVDDPQPPGLPSYAELAAQSGLRPDAADPEVEALVDGFILQSTALLPLGSTLLLAAWCFLAPYVVRSSLMAETQTGLERLLLLGGRLRWPLIGLGVVVNGLVLYALRTEACRAAARRGGIGLMSLAKLALFLPLLGAVMIVLASIFVPLLNALTTG